MHTVPKFVLNRPQSTQVCWFASYSSFSFVKVGGIEQLPSQGHIGYEQGYNIFEVHYIACKRKLDSFLKNIGIRVMKQVMQIFKIDSNSKNSYCVTIHT